MRYFNLIFTKHALIRISERGLTKELAWETFNHSDKTREAKSGGMEFAKKFENFRAILIARQNDKNEWIVISFWRDPPLPEAQDAKIAKQWEAYKKSGFWGKVLITIKQQLGF